MTPRLPWSRERTVATVDIGTNSCLILIAGVNAANREYRIVADESNITQLGKGFYQARRLTAEAIERTLNALREFRRIGGEREVDEYVITGTSVLRDAPNGAEFTDAVRELFDTEVEVLSGEEEARLAYLAVRRDPVLALPPDATCVVMDVGGGSTELIVGDERIRQMASLNVGAVRLTESFLPSDPPTRDELASLQKRLDEAFGDAPEYAPTSALVGVAGTVANLANVALHRSLDRRNVHGFALSSGELSEQIAEFRRLTTVERSAIPGIEPKRAGVILAGALIIERAMTHYRHDAVVASVRGIRFGLFYDRFLDGARGWEPAVD